ncbi:hypothetical protein HZ326_8401 [Fusarium oxysporum f. sp. albedinis]|nr:hypothetical protein HZ326_8401 [Fusarium oxysporum f. sp. albedinis]
MPHVTIKGSAECLRSKKGEQLLIKSLDDSAYPLLANTWLSVKERWHLKPLCVQPITGLVAFEHLPEVVKR